nr:NADH dehydrogenase subunit 4 [Ptilocnemus lemur]
MMSMYFIVFFLIVGIFYVDWWLMVFILMFTFFVFFNKLWFMGYYSSLSYSFGGDTLSFCMIFLSFWIVFLMIMASFNIYSSKLYFLEFIFLVLILLLLLIFSFSTMSLFNFYFFFECSLIPTLVLIFGWGYQPERLSSGLYLLFYTLFMSLPLLVSIFYINYNNMTSFFYLIEIDVDIYLYLCLLMAFLVKMPMVFFHFWLPKAHVEAPISGSMILAGVLLKLGGYGLLRVYNFINGFFNYNLIFISLSMYGICIIGILCLFQVDIKSLIAYSSVAHMGLVIGGIMVMNYWGLYGSLVLMIGHGLCSSGLFCLANILYERTCSRSFYINKGLITLMPSLSMFWFILCVNNMASPPSLNLLGEIFIINSLLSWSLYCFLFIFLGSFFSCCYSIYLYSYVQHGFIYSGINMLSYTNVREFYLIFFHLLPLNLLVFKVDILVLWF